MANQYKNKVVYGNQTLMDITDTTAEANDVIEGQLFYTKSGAPTTGTLGDATTTTHGLMSAEDKIKLDSIDLTGKADKVTNATNGNFAGLDANGNLTDSGVSATGLPAIDDTAGAGDTNKIWSADKSTDEVITLNDKIENTVAIQNTQPTSTDNKLWIDTSNTPTEVQVPTYTEFTNLYNAIDAKPDMKHDSSAYADLDITDEDGYVLARFSNGQFQTKNFDSSSVPAIRSTTAPGIPLDIVDENGYVILRLKNGHIQTKNFDSSVESVGFEYKFSGNDLLIGYGYNETNDAVIVMNCGRANGLFDFAGLKTKPKGTSLKNLETADLTTVWSSGTDMHGPFQFLANQNADGYHADATSAGFVGGNHTLDQLGTGFETAESVYVKFYADGVPVSSGYGKATKFEIRWANDVQAYNTVKQGGGGRACLREIHDMVFDGIRFNERVTLIPLEEITMSLWYGLQCVAIGSVYTNIAFVDATNRQIFASSDSNIESGNNVTSGFIGYGNNHRIEMSVNTGIDLGKRGFYSGNRGAFVSSTKGYFFIIGQNVTMSSNTSYYLDGSFRFMPTTEE